jgi:uncharacterized membrane protein YcgQ (UPF0703/DUF1980 family)
MAQLNQSDSKKIKNLMVKVKALAERGENGEMDNAKQKLKELMQKYQITKFEEQKYKKRSFKLADYNDCKTIMVHCILDSSPDAEIDGSLQKKELYCKLTDEQYIDVCEKFNHYFPEFHKQREAFVKAFIIKNNLGIENTVSDEEEESVSDILDMMNGIKSSSYKKNKAVLLAC